MHLARWSSCLAVGLGAFAVAALAHAQAAPPATPPALACIPSCRSGYVCIDAKCIQACNPPCPDGQICTSDAQCIAAAPPVAAPVAPVAVAPGAGAVYPQWGAGGPVPPGAFENPKGVRFHDGFYLRMALGIGALSATYRVGSGTNPEHSRGIALMDEFAIGGTPSPGVVIGGGIYGSTTPSPTIDIDGSRIGMGAVGVGVIAPFVDVYPRPTGGLHIQGAIGVAVLSAAEGDSQQSCGSGGLGTSCSSIRAPADDYVGAGLGIVSGIGYETWVADQWSVGFLARLTYVSGKMSAVNDTGRQDVKVSGIVTGALVSVTYH